MPGLTLFLNAENHPNCFSLSPISWISGLILLWKQAITGKNLSVSIRFLVTLYWLWPLWPWNPDCLGPRNCKDDKTVLISQGVRTLVFASALVPRSSFLAAPLGTARYIIWDYTFIDEYVDLSVNRNRLYEWLAEKKLVYIIEYP